ncbi:MAG: AAA family ATPase [Candidatus Latescibacteria bacterium]|nr:AAA family ATPase [Candidatus Latescibacterota bacterium]NIO57415.1 AAA family ATPase [Candidatus Latescibacterota bacterium]
MKTIAISGKGGTGKTTLAALMVRQLSDYSKGSVLAVDADANVSLNELLGVELRETIGVIREEMRDSVDNLPGGMTKQRFLEYKIQTSLVETSAFDLIAMGRPEGPGCYCYANNLLRDILATLSANYGYVVIDNEAGMEHLSRRTHQSIDYLLIVSDPSVRGIRTAGKISRLLKELDTRVGEKDLVLNRVQGPVPEAVVEAIQDEGLTLISSIPEDSWILELDQKGLSIDHLSADASAHRAVGEILKNIGIYPEN